MAQARKKQRWFRRANNLIDTVSFSQSASKERNPPDQTAIMGCMPRSSHHVRYSNRPRPLREKCQSVYLCKGLLPRTLCLHIPSHRSALSFTSVSNVPEFMTHFPTYLAYSIAGQPRVSCRSDNIARRSKKYRSVPLPSGSRSLPFEVIASWKSEERRTHLLKRLRKRE